MVRIEPGVQALGARALCQVIIYNGRPTYGKKVTQKRLYGKIDFCKE